MTNTGERRRRRALLLAVLGFLQLEPDAPELRQVRRWLENWHGGMGCVEAL